MFACVSVSMCLRVLVCVDVLAYVCVCVCVPLLLALVALTLSLSDSTLGIIATGAMPPTSPGREERKGERGGERGETQGTRQERAGRENEEGAMCNGGITSQGCRWKGVIRMEGNNEGCKGVTWRGSGSNRLRGGGVPNGEKAPLPLPRLPVSASLLNKKELKRLSELSQ